MQSILRYSRCMLIITLRSKEEFQPKALIIVICDIWYINIFRKLSRQYTLRYLRFYNIVRSYQILKFIPPTINGSFTILVSSCQRSFHCAPDVLLTRIEQYAL